MLRFMRKYWIFAVLAAGFMVAEVTVDMMQPKLMARIVDEGILGINNSGTPDIPLIASVGVRMILVVLLGGLCGMLSGTMANMSSQNFANGVRKSCFERIMRLSFQQTDKFTTGSLITRVTNDVSQMERLVQMSVRGFVRSLMFMFAGTMTLLSLNIHFLIIIAIAFPLLLMNIGILLYRVSPKFTILQEKLDKLNSVIQENIAGARVVKAFVQEKKEGARFGASNDDLVGTQLSLLLTMSLLRPAMNIILNLATVALIYIGAIEVEAGGMLPGEVMAGVTYISQILSGMMMLAMMFPMISRGMASARRLNEILRTEPAIKDGAGVAINGAHAAESSDAPDAVSSTAEAGSIPAIEFRDVSFSYPDGSGNVLSDIDLKIMRGETLAIVGSTGSGKTSLVNLIPRFYDSTEGTVLVDGFDVKEYGLKELRDKISFVTQKNELFSTTIEENIRIGKPDASEEAVRLAAAAAQAAPFIEEQPDGYGTAVAEKGASLSGGQRQRVAIARALLKGADILILDDATSALDLKTEAALYKALDENYGDITKVVIAQRIATIKRADRIAVLDGNTICAIGTHEELYESSPVYRDICNSQTGEGGAA